MMLFVSNLVVVTTIPNVFDAGGHGRIHTRIFWESQTGHAREGWKKWVLRGQLMETDKNCRRSVGKRPLAAIVR
jgi:hypothetical protein